MVSSPGGWYPALAAAPSRGLIPTIVVSTRPVQGESLTSLARTSSLPSRRARLEALPRLLPGERLATERRQNFSLAKEPLSSALRRHRRSKALHAEPRVRKDFNIKPNFTDFLRPIASRSPLLRFQEFTRVATRVSASIVLTEFNVTELIAYREIIDQSLDIVTHVLKIIRDESETAKDEIDHMPTYESLYSTIHKLSFLDSRISGIEYLVKSIAGDDTTGYAYDNHKPTPLALKYGEIVRFMDKGWQNYNRNKYADRQGLPPVEISFPKARTKRGTTLVPVLIRGLSFISTAFTGIAALSDFKAASSKIVDPIQELLRDSTSLSANRIETPQANSFHSLTSNTVMVLQRIGKKLERNFGYTGRAGNSKTYATPYYYDSFREKYQIAALAISNINSMLREIDNYILEVTARADAFEQAISGKIPVQLFPPQEVLKTLSNINDQKDPSLIMAFDGLFRDLTEFYTLKAHFFVDPDQEHIVNIGVIIPLIDQDYIREVYQYLPSRIPLPYPKLGLDLIVKSKHNLLMVNKDHTVHSDINMSQLSTCNKIGNMHICPRFGSSTSSMSCLYSMLKDKSESTLLYCSFNVYRRSRDIEAIKISATGWMVQTSRERAVQVQCQDNYIVTKRIPPGLFMVTPPFSCTMALDDILTHGAESETTATLDDQQYISVFFRQTPQETVKHLRHKYPNIDFSQQGLTRLASQLAPGGYSLDLGLLNFQSAATLKKNFTDYIIIGSLVVALLTLITVILVVWKYGSLLTKLGRCWFRQNPSTQEQFPARLGPFPAPSRLGFFRPAAARDRSRSPSPTDDQRPQKKKPKPRSRARYCSPPREAAAGPYPDSDSLKLQTPDQNYSPVPLLSNKDQRTVSATLAKAAGYPPESLQGLFQQPTRPIPHRDAQCTSHP